MAEQKTSGVSIWLKGLGAAVLGGAGGAVIDLATAGTLDPKQIRGGAIAGAILATAGYLKLKKPPVSK